MPMKLEDLIGLSLKPIKKRFLHWFYAKLEEHYTICQFAEEDKATQASKNAWYYVRKALDARCKKLDNQ